MILVDTSIWISHLRARNRALERLLENGQVLAHPSVIGELALGHLKPRDVILGGLADLPQARVATDGEVLHFIEHSDLAGRGIGYVDTHLLASSRLTPDTLLWTGDRRLREAASRLNLAM